MPRKWMSRINVFDGNDRWLVILQERPPTCNIAATADAHFPKTAFNPSILVSVFRRYEHRKLLLMALERIIWGFGDGSPVHVFEIAVGKIGVGVQPYVGRIECLFRGQQSAAALAADVSAAIGGGGVERLRPWLKTSPELAGKKPSMGCLMISSFVFSANSAPPPVVPWILSTF
ncbi:hypothetical protein Vadar_033371 [Vaccinium darrowii]|uniref:Uncharacterized protein n=1 Tax=Vaccinium darrowii TaxID=229202 RepID=A0ACB7ZG46_9ERIC|nr:hypothetical protein Vadar_033371 [Vaccinium darrowii]